MSRPRLLMQVPTERQIIQRDEKNGADVLLRGWVKISDESEPYVLVRATPRDNPTVLQEAIFTLHWQEAGRASFEGTVRLPAGGWYRLRAELHVKTSPDRILASASVDRLGVGDIFVVAGQSNAANYGERRQVPHSDRISTYDGKSGEWRWAADPQPMATGRLGSPWPILGDLLEKEWNIPIGFADVAVGGSGVHTWTPESPYGYYLPLREVLVHLGRVRAVLWHQGENDASAPLTPQTARDYHDTLKMIIETSRRDAGYRVPWFVANASLMPGLPDIPQGRAQMEAIREGQRMLWADGTALEGPDTDDLRGPEYRWDIVHLSVKGLQEHARRWQLAISKT